MVGFENLLSEVVYVARPLVLLLFVVVEKVLSQITMKGSDDTRLLYR